MQQEAPGREHASDPNGTEQAEGAPLGSYVRAVTSWWREILLLGVAAGVLGGLLPVVLDQLAPRYTASADVAIIPRRANVALDVRFAAVEGATRRTRIDPQGQRAALVGLVNKPNLAEQVLDQLKEQFDEDMRPADLVEKVAAELVVIGMTGHRPESDLIRITVEADSPPLAKAFADAWAETFVTDVNLLYEVVPSDVIETVRAERDSVRERYLNAEIALQAFTTTSEIDLLTKQIEAKQELIGQVVSTWRLTATASFQRDIESRLATLDDSLAKLRRLEADLRDARGLMAQLGADTPSSTATNGLAIYLFKARLIGGAPTLELSLGDMLEVSAIDQQKDMEATSGSLQQQVEQLRTAVQEQTSDLSSLVGQTSGTETGSIRDEFDKMATYLDTTRDQPMMALLAELEAEKRSLTARRDQGVAQQNDLTLERDLMRSTLTTLQNEMVELELTVASAPSQVRLASLAVVPTNSAWPAPAQVAAVFLPIGLVGAFFLSVVVSALGRQPPLRGWRSPRRR